MSDMVFGGGSELLAAGNDKRNVRSVLEDAIVCVLPLLRGADRSDMAFI